MHTDYDAIENAIIYGVHEPSWCNNIVANIDSFLDYINIYVTLKNVMLILPVAFVDLILMSKTVFATKPV